jgi:tetratricopeptide (TPR) repeat protein
MAQTSLSEQGIAAYKAGNLAESRKLLAQAVKVERENDMAWYYLSKTQSDPEKRRYCLEMALKLNPENLSAQRDLEAAADPAPHRNTMVAEAPSKPSPATSKPASFSMRVPAGIAGAPERLSLDYTRDFVREMSQESMALVTGKPGLVNAEASWWRVIFTVALTGFVIGLIYDLAQFVNVLQLSQFGWRLHLGSLILTPFLTAFKAVIAVGAGALLSHWYITTQRGGTASQLDHALLMTKIWAPASLALAVLALVGMVFSRGIVTLYGFLMTNVFSLDAGTLIFTLLAAGITGYAAYLMVKGMQKLYPAMTDNHLWATAAVMLIVTALVF